MTSPVRFMRFIGNKVLFEPNLYFGFSRCERLQHENRRKCKL